MNTIYNGKREALARLRTAAPAVEVEGDRYDCTGIGPDEYDGGAYGIASHFLNADGIEVEGAHVVWLGSVIAQPADVRALRLHSVQWHGAAAGSGDEGDRGALADGTRSRRQAGVALVADDGCNLTRTTTDGTTRERWTNVRADRARDLHALAGTQCPDYIAEVEAHAIVGAMPTTPRRHHTHHAVAYDVVERQADGTYRTRVAYRTRALRTGQDHDHAVLLPHTARLVLHREDARTEADRNAATPGRSEARRARAVYRRQVAAQAVVVQALQVGEPITGRADSLTVRMTQAACVVAALVGRSPADVLAGYVID